MHGIVFNIQRFSLFDGPGVRTVVFLKGCPLRCLWCHNPEGFALQPQVMFNGSKCIGCGDCAEACPAGCHVMQDGMHSYSREACTDCGRCADACCCAALTIAGKKMEAEEVMKTVLRDAAVYRENGGGLTVSGGEPFMQADFAIALFRLAKEAGISTCVETSGYADPAKFREAAAYVDTFLFDYKATGEDMHRMLCGVGQERILGNLAALDELGGTVVLRCPIIPGLNDIPSHFDGIARVAREHACVREVQLEPYHRLGISKAKQLGTAAAYEGQPPSKEEMAEYCRRIADACGKSVTVS